MTFFFLEKSVVGKSVGFDFADPKYVGNKSVKLPTVLLSFFRFHSRLRVFCVVKYKKSLCFVKGFFCVIYVINNIIQKLLTLVGFKSDFQTRYFQRYRHCPPKKSREAAPMFLY
jgi:hypothetical protein